MQINRRITNGLAWAGLFVVVAVPVADVISAQLMGDKDEIALASVVDAPLKPRPQTPVTEIAAPAKPAGSTDAVESFLSSGKPLPSYITGGAPAAPAVATTPAPVVSKPTAKPEAIAAVPVAATPTPDPVEVATVTPAKIAPVPMPLSMRPAPVIRPVVSPAVTEEIVLPPEVLARNDAPMVVDDLRDWESGPLSDFLAKRQGQRSSAQVRGPNGFFLSDGPNMRRQRDVYLGPVEDGYYPFDN